MVWFDILVKTPGLYLVSEVRYGWFGLVWYGFVWFDVLAKTPRLNIVPWLRYWVKYLVEKMIESGPTELGPSQAQVGNGALDVLAKTPDLYLIPGLRYWVKYLDEKTITHKNRNRKTIIVFYSIYIYILGPHLWPPASLVTSSSTCSLQLHLKTPVSLVASSLTGSLQYHLQPPP